VFANQMLLRDLMRGCEKGEIADPAKARAGIVEVLASSGQQADAADALLATLQSEFAKIKAALAPPAPTKPGEAPAPPPPPPENVVVVEQAVLQASAAAMVPAEKTKDAFVAPQKVEVEAAPVDTVAKYEAMPLGSWIDLVAEDGKITSAKVSFISPISGKRILSNRRGQRCLCASVQELAAMEANGQIKPRHSDSAFENALGKVGKRLESDAKKPDPVAA
jgi:hypothetical protein